MVSASQNRTQLNDVRNSVVKINNGTGFFVLPGIITTCYHNIAKSSQDKIKITWNNNQLNIINIIEPINHNNPDLVLIEVDKTNHPILPIGENKAVKGDIYSYGFQYTDRQYDGYPVTGVHGDNTVWGKDNEKQTLIVIPIANIQPGLSGAPLFSENEQKVIGVIKRDNPDGGGYAIPITRLEELDFDILNKNHKICKKIDSVYAQYIEHISNEHKYLQLIDRQRGELKLEDIYVTLTLAPESFTGKRLSLDVNGNLYSNSSSKIGKIDARRDTGTPHRHYLEREIPLQELVVKRKAIILGDPGSGKTTLLRHLLIRTCKNELFINKLPVFIKLADLQKKVGCINEYLENSYRYFYPRLEEGLNNGEIVFFIDGFDEVPKDSYGIFQREINRLASIKNHVFLTCRTASFPRGLFSGEFNIYECIGFNTAQQRRFLNRWFLKTPKISAKVWRDIQKNKGTFGLSKNPLLLSLMAIIYENDPSFRLPLLRVGLYARSIDLLMEIRSNIYNGRKISKRDRFKTLQYIAYRMFCQGAEAITEDELLDIIEDYQMQSQRHALKRFSSEDILKALVEQDGILTHHSQTSFRFLHLTFQEYLTASLISKDEDCLQIISSNVLDPRWEEVIRLLGGLLPSDKSCGILEMIWNDKIEDTYTYDRLLLAGRCASDSQCTKIEQIDSIKEELETIAFNTNIDTLSNDSFVALASLYSSYSQCLVSLFDFFERQLNSGNITRRLLERYIRVLQLTSTKDSFDELVKVYKIFSKLELNDEDSKQIISSIVRGLGQIGNEELSNEIFHLIRLDSSYVSSNATLTLASIQPTSIKNELIDNINNRKYFDRVLIAYILFKYEEQDINMQLLQKAYRENYYDLQLLSTQCINIQSLNISEHEVLDLMDNCQDNESKAHLLNNYSIFVYVQHPNFIKKLITTDDTPVIVKCAAIETFIRIHPEQAYDMFHFAFSDICFVDLQLITISSLAEVGTSSIYDFLFKKITYESNQRVILAFLRVLTDSPINVAGKWIVTLLDHFNIFSRIHSYAILALASTGNQKAIPYIENNLLNSSENQVRNKKIAYKALGFLHCEESVELLDKYLFKENNIVLINQIIISLGNTNMIQAETSLLRCLSVDNWPKRWPSQKQPVQKGEQKPSDQRRLSAIFSLKKITSIESLSYLKRIIEDKSEAGEIREAAFMTIRDISWAKRIYNE